MSDMARLRVLITVLMVAVLALALGVAAGCGNNGGKDDATPTGPGEPAAPVDPDSAAKGRVLVVVADTDYNDVECDAVLLALAGTGYDVVVANSSGLDSTGDSGGVLPVDTTLDKVDAADYEAVVFVGGMGATQYFEDQVVLALADEMAAGGKLVTAICIAPVILANAGVLQGKSATVSAGGAAALEAGGAVFTDQPVVVDGDIITGRDPGAADEFAQAVTQSLK